MTGKVQKDEITWFQTFIKSNFWPINNNFSPTQLIGRGKCNYMGKAMNAGLTPSLLDNYLWSLGSRWQQLFNMDCHKGGRNCKLARCQNLESKDLDRLGNWI